MRKFVHVAIVFFLMTVSNPVHAEADVDAIRAAAEGGNVSAMNAMGSLYYHDHGVPQSNKESMKWFLLAAEGGHVGAQSIVGMMFLQDGEEGSGKYWLRRVAMQGDPVAQRQLDVLKKKQE